MKGERARKEDKVQEKQRKEYQTGIGEEWEKISGGGQGRKGGKGKDKSIR